MGLVFIGHASANNPEAMALSDWLVAEGWDDLFLDLHPTRGIVAGERWQAALKTAAERCEVVIFLISPDWIGSKWCLAEFLLAKQLNKQIMGVIVQPTPIKELPVELVAEWQLVDLTSGNRDRRFDVIVPPDTPATVAFSSDGLARLKIGLQKAGLDPTHFAWPPESDPNRPPYRGLRPLEADDAGIFFGRDGPIVLGLDRLRGMRDAGTPEILVVLGASGAGKSSFMRAGLLPRLARDEQHFLPLPIIRPDRAVITGDEGLLAGLETAVESAGLKRSRADIRTAVQGGSETLRALLAELVERRRPVLDRDGVAPAPPTVVLTVDQAEELFIADGAEEANRFLALLRDIVTAKSPTIIVLFAVRTDSYEKLQTAASLEGLNQQFLSLPPMPAGAFGDVIRGPARRLAGSKRPLKIDETLVDTLLSDIEAGGAKDALPLLAFTLERLYREHGGDGDLKLAEYQELGGIKGSIEAAVERALKVADADPGVPRDKAARLALLRRGLIPWLAGIDPDTGSPRRRVARMSEIPAEARPLVTLLIEQRLLATDRDSDTGEVTVEPAHEALLRQWGLLEGWLEEDFPVLATLESVRRAARDWAANGKRPEWLAHSGARLVEADAAAARDDVGKLLQPTDHAYLAAARSAEVARQQAEIRALRRQRAFVLAGAAVLAVAAVGLYWLWTLSEAARREASASLSVVRSQNALRDGDIAAAVENGLAAMATLDSPETRSAALAALLEVSPHLEAIYPLGTERLASLAWLTPGTVAVGTGAKKVYTLKTPGSGGAEAAVTAPVGETVGGVPTSIYALTGGGMAAVFDDGRIEFLGHGTAAPPDEAAAAKLSLVLGQHSVDASDGASTIVRASMNDGVLLRDCPEAAACRSLTLPVRNPSAVSISPDGTRLAVGDESGAVRIFDAHGDEAAPAALDGGAEVRALDWSPVGNLLAIGTGKGELLIADATPGSAPGILFRKKLSPIIQALRWSPVASELAFVCGGTDVCILRPDKAAGSYRVAERFAGAGAITGLRWSPDGAHLATIGADSKLRIWSAAPDRAVRYTLRTGADGALRSLAFDASRKLLAAGDAEGGVWVWAEGSDDATRFVAPASRGAPVTSVAWSADGLLAATYEKAGIAIFDPGTGTLVRFEKFPGARLASWIGGVVALPLNDGRIALIDAKPGTAIAWLGPVPDPKEPWNVIGLADGKRLLASYTDGSIQIWDIAAKALAGALATKDVVGPGGDGAGSLSLSPDGRWLAASRLDETVVLYDTTGAGEPRRLGSARKGTNTVAFSPAGDRLAALGSDGRLYVWDLAAGDAPALALSPVPERSAAGRSGSSTRPATWLAWLDDSHLAVATIAGEVEVLSLDPLRWHARSSLFAGQEG